MGNKVDTIDSAVKRRLESVRGLLDDIERLHGETSSLVVETNGKIVDVTRILWRSSSISHFERDGFGSQRPWRKVVELATKSLDEAYAEAKAIHESNRTSMKNNFAVRESVTKFMVSIGMPERVPDPSSRKRIKDTMSAMWLQELWKFCPVTDGFQGAEEGYNKAIRAIGDYSRKKEEEEAQEKRKQEEEKKREERLYQRVEMCVKLGIPGDTSEWEILETILKKSKYLRLAHAMQETRGDWSEGPYRVEDALDLFDVVNEDDKAIHAEIHELTSDWDGDGRVYRDCTHNYTVLFSMVSPDVYDIYSGFMKHRESQ